MVYDQATGTSGPGPKLNQERNSTELELLWQRLEELVSRANDVLGRTTGLAERLCGGTPPGGPQTDSPKEVRSGLLGQFADEIDLLSHYIDATQEQLLRLEAGI